MSKANVSKYSAVKRVCVCVAIKHVTCNSEHNVLQQMVTATRCTTCGRRSSEYANMCPNTKYSGIAAFATYLAKLKANT